MPVILNRQALEHDHIVICGPVFPHESVGFSGGNKYLFPGIAGLDTISTFHWLSAMLTTMNVIGYQDTPVRALIDRYAACLPTPVSCVATVVSESGVHGVFTGDARTAQAQAARLSAQVHVVYLDKPVHTVIAAVADRYDDLWTGGKGMYKTEPVVSDGGRVVIYAPHITEVSYTHGKSLDEIGYHVRDYFALQMERFAHVPKVAMAHSTNVKGAGVVRSSDAGGDAAHPGRRGDRHPAGALPAHQPGLRRSRRPVPRGLGAPGAGRRWYPCRPACRRATVPAQKIKSSRPASPPALSKSRG